MEIAIIALQQTLVMFLLIAIGYTLYKTKKITKEGSRDMAATLLHIILPCVIVKSFCTEYSVEKSNHLLISFVLSVVCLGISMLISRLFFKKRYRWEDIAFICYGEVKCSKSMSDGLFFSTKAVKKNGKKMTPYKVYHSLHFWECFYIIFEDKKQEEILKCLNTWGVNYSVEESLLQRKSYERSLEEKIRMREERKRLYEDRKKRKR